MNLIVTKHGIVILGKIEPIMNSLEKMPLELTLKEYIKLKLQ